MSDQNDHPLLTFALISYNQERFIREAVEAAFAQTYSPLEIILSDDCSSDRTFDLMREMAAAYRGPHRIVLNRNAVRSGLGGHVNRMMELQHGELVVIAAGDDISLPERTQVLYDAWKSDGKQATTVHSSVIKINEAGAALETPPPPRVPGTPLPLSVQSAVPSEFMRNLKPSVTGCANAWVPRLFSVFGPLPKNVIYEDQAITFRSILAGRILLVDVPLVKYRQHRENIWNQSRVVATSITSIRNEERRTQNVFQGCAIMEAGFLADLETARAQGLLSEETYGRARGAGQRLREAYELQARYLQSGLWTKTGILWRLWRMKEDSVAWRKLRRRWLPANLVLIMRLGLSRLRASTTFLKRRTSP
jgi:hypothetical protein